MKHSRYAAFGLLALLPLANMSIGAGAEGDEDSRSTPLPALVKIPSRTGIVKDTDIDQEAKQVAQWVNVLIESKEKRANIELQQIKKELLEQEAKRESEARERRKKEERFSEIYGTVGARSGNKQDNSLRVRLDFYVPEIDSYRAVVETYLLQRSLADDVVDTLKRLDRDRDGILSGEEYREAAALANATARMFQSLDQNADGVLNETEIYAARNLPADAASALKQGRSSGEAAKIKTFDADGNGTLDVDERKALTMAYVELSVRCGKESTFYKQVQDTLVAARDVVGAKFANVEVKP